MIEQQTLAEQPLAAWDGNHMMEAFQASEQWLRHHVPTINNLNVFPVPDGDTGTNMHMTLRAALGDVSPANSCAQVVEQVYRNALMGARGNSGVILSQILRGLAQGLKDHEKCGPAEFVQALAQASTSAYGSTSDPREGTILTVIRETSEAAERALKQKGVDLLSVLTTSVESARASVQRTPELLKVLKDAGVVDAGGQGLYIILEGMLRWARGESVSDGVPGGADAEAEQVLNFDELHDDDESGYCTNFLLRGEALPIDDIRQHMHGVGRSVVVVGDETLLRVHVHTMQPGDMLNYGQQYGELVNIEITNMDEQRAERRRQHEQQGGQQQQATDAPSQRNGQESETESRVGVVAVAAGEGLIDIFRSLGVHSIVQGGQTMNPSTQDVLQAIEALPHEEVLVLPNNSNILMAAQQAAEHASKQVQVLKSKTIPQGFAAMIRFSPVYDLQGNMEAMQQELEMVSIAEITTAVRDANLDGQTVRQGQTMALLNGSFAVAGDDEREVIASVLQQMDMEAFEHVTVYYGKDVSAQAAQKLAEQLQEWYPEHAIELSAGGQPVYRYILAAE